MHWGSYHVGAWARLSPVGTALAFGFSYEPEMVAALKARIPTTGRRWDPERRYWLIDPQFAPVCAELADRYLGIATILPPSAYVPRTETRIIRLEYLGRVKARGFDEISAMGWADGAWSAVFPDGVLREWFSLPAQPGEGATLYGVLGLGKDAQADTLRAAYRRLVRQWHPDVCREPDAAEQFKTIQHAWSVLSNPVQRRKYDAGLALEATLPQRLDPTTFSFWRPPLRCGWVCAEGTVRLDRFIVARILRWEDIIDEYGRTLVTHWPTGADMFESTWS